MTQTPQTALPRMPSSTDVYDALMGDIEPELVSVHLQGLEERYRGETKQERTARYERYKMAFAKYDRAFEEWSANFHLAVSAYRHSAMGAAEGKSKEVENAALAAIEAQFHTHNP